MGSASEFPRKVASFSTYLDFVKTRSSCRHNGDDGEERSETKGHLGANDKANGRTLPLNYCE